MSKRYYGNAFDPALGKEISKLIAGRSASVAPARFRGAPHRTTTGECPLCKGSARSFLTVSDLSGSSWSLLDCSGCSENQGGIVEAGPVPSDVTPGAHWVTHAFGLGADDLRWDACRDVLGALDVSTACSIMSEALAKLDAPNLELIDDYIGGGLATYESTIRDALMYEVWEGSSDWVPLCTLDWRKIPGEDTLVAVVSPSFRTGLWILA